MGKAQPACKPRNLELSFTNSLGDDMIGKLIWRLLCGFLCLAVIAFGFTAQDVTASASTTKKLPPVAKTTDKHKPQDAPPMSFVVVRLSLSTCEPNCPQWIAAEGRIENNTPAALARLLANPVYRKLPLILNSGGGKIFAALEMGRMIRKYGMNTSVGYTSFLNCNPFETKDGTCKPSADTKAYPAYAFAYRGYCFSACPLILLGGVVRIVDKDAHVGLHEPVDERHPYVDHFWIAWHMVNGKKVIVSRKLINRTYLKATTTVGVTPQLKQRLLPYFKEMGGSPALIDEMDKAAPEKMNVIAWKDGEREKLGLVTSNNQPLSLLTTAEHCKFAGTFRANCIYAKERKPHIFLPIDRS